jgi:ABC-type nitrate/sulfonate/bicarbonate transport system substrate-binding protein
MAGVADKVELKNVPAVDLQAGFGHGVDAGSTGEPYVSKILAEMPGSHVIVRGGGIANTRVLIFTTDEWLNANPALAEQFWAASAEATQYLRQHPDDSAAAASRVLGGIDANIIRKAFENFTFDPRHSAKIDNGFLTESKLLVEQKRIPSVPNISDAIAVDLMESAQAKYKEYLSDLPPIQP